MSPMYHISVLLLATVEWGEIRQRISKAFQPPGCSDHNFQILHQLLYPRGQLKRTRYIIYTDDLINGNILLPVANIILFQEGKDSPYQLYHLQGGREVLVVAYPVKGVIIALGDTTIYRLGSHSSGGYRVTYSPTQIMPGESNVVDSYSHCKRTNHPTVRSLSLVSPQYLWCLQKWTNLCILRVLSPRVRSPPPLRLLPLAPFGHRVPCAFRALDALLIR